MSTAKSVSSQHATLAQPEAEVNTVSPLPWPEGLEPAAVLKGYLDGLADTPNHTRRDAAYWYGHLNALADRQPRNSPDMDRACQPLCH